MAGVRIIGLKAAQARFDWVMRQEPKAIADALAWAGQIVAGEAKKTVYEHRQTRKEKKAGIEVATPHVHLWKRSGALRASLISEVDPSGRRAYVGSKLVYAPVHEFGADIQIGAQSRLAGLVGRTYGKGKSKRLVVSSRKRYSMGGHMIHIPKRPYLGPALEAKREAINKRFRQTIERVLAGKPT